MTKINRYKEKWVKEQTNILFISDAHLGHRKTPVAVTCRSILDMVMSVSANNKLDMLIFPGDFLDRALMMGSVEVNETMGLVGRLLVICKTKNIIVRFLEGTKLHDERQFKPVQALIDGLGYAVDIRYMDSVCVEHIPTLGIDLLYVPDEWHPDTNKTFSDCLSVITEQGKKNVDIGVMHGMFNFQIPVTDHHIPCHNETDYLHVVNAYVVIGHDHTRQHHDRIIVPGSFDRTAHGMESPKGAVLVTLNKYTENTWVFLPNKKATIYKTVKIQGQPEGDSLVSLQTTLKKLPNGSHIKLKVSKDLPCNELLAVLRRTFPMLHITKETDKVKATTSKLFSKQTTPTYKAPVLSANTIVEEVLTLLDSKYGVPNREALTKYMEAVIT